MKKIILIGRVGCGKTTLTQALKGEKLTYFKTQYINHFDMIIDTPGEYAENKTLVKALVLYSFEADVIGILASSMEEYTIFRPHLAYIANRPVIGLVTQVDRPEGRPDWAYLWLKETGCNPIFFVSAVTGEGIPDLMDYLRDPGEVLPWDNDPDYWEARKQAKARENQYNVGFDRLK